MISHLQSCHLNLDPDLTLDLDSTFWNKLTCSKEIRMEAGQNNSNSTSLMGSIVTGMYAVCCLYNVCIYSIHGKTLCSLRGRFFS